MLSFISIQDTKGEKGFFNTGVFTGDFPGMGKSFWLRSLWLMLYQEHSESQVSTLWAEPANGAPACVHCYQQISGHSGRKLAFVARAERTALGTAWSKLGLLQLSSPKRSF